MPGWFTGLQRWRYVISGAVDATLWFVALYLAALARLNFEPSAISMPRYVAVATIAATVQLLAGTAIGLYRGRRTIASFGEVLLVVATSLTAGAAALLLILFQGPPSLVPTSAVLAATAYQMLGRPRPPIWRPARHRDPVEVTTCTREPPADLRGGRRRPTDRPCAPPRSHNGLRPCGNPRRRPDEAPPEGARSARRW